MIVEIVISEQKQTTLIGLKSKEHKEAYNNKIDIDYDADDTLFTGCIYNLTELDFNEFNRSECGKGTHSKQDINEVIGNSCYTPTSGFFYLNCFNPSTGKISKQILFDFVRDEKRKNNIMTTARNQHFCIADIFKIGYFNGKLFTIELYRKNEA